MPAWPARPACPYHFALSSHSEQLCPYRLWKRGQRSRGRFLTDADHNPDSHPDGNTNTHSNTSDANGNRLAIAGYQPDTNADPDPDSH